MSVITEVPIQQSCSETAKVKTGTSRLHQNGDKYSKLLQTRPRAVRKQDKLVGMACVREVVSHFLVRFAAFS